MVMVRFSPAVLVQRPSGGSLNLLSPGPSLPENIWNNRRGDICPVIRTSCHHLVIDLAWSSWFISMICGIYHEQGWIEMVDGHYQDVNVYSL